MPRAQTLGTGLPGPGQVIFPEEPKEHGRSVALTTTARLLVNTAGLDPTGSPLPEEWAESGAPIACRVDPLSMDQVAQHVGDQIDERSTHYITLEPTAEVTTDERLRIDGTDWLVTQVPEQTDRMVKRVEGVEAT